MMPQTVKRSAAEIRELEQSAVRLLTSLKGVAEARVAFDDAGQVARIAIVPHATDDRSAMRNVQSALMAVMGLSLDINAIAIVDGVDGLDGFDAAAAATHPAPAPEPQPAAQGDEGVLELRIPPVRNGELNVAARVAFDTLRMAQSSFNGFQFDGAELVRITGQQYVVVAVRHAASDAKYCGAAAVVESVSTASARALMNAVGTAAMGSSALALDVDGGRRLEA
jgi:hypothetical protein